MRSRYYRAAGKSMKSVFLWQHTVMGEGDEVSSSHLGGSSLLFFLLSLPHLCHVCGVSPEKKTALLLPLIGSSQLRGWR